MLTVYRMGDMILTCGENETVHCDTVEGFFKNLLCYKDQTIFVYELQLLSLFFIRALEDLGFMDATLFELSYTENHKLDRETYKYTLSAENHAFYNISYNHNGKIYTIYEFKNIMSAEIEDVVKDFGGLEPVAMHRAVIGMRSFSKKATTVSGCAYAVWKKGLGLSKGAFDGLFPQCSDNIEQICRDAYHGGLCYVQDGIRCNDLGDGIVLDVNSLYPYVMKTKKFAIGEGHYGKGEIPDDILKADDKTYYVRFRARFELKPGHIPFVRTRCDKNHWQLEVLESSAYIDYNGNRYDYMQAIGYDYVDEWGEIHKDSKPFEVELCLYKPEFELFFEQYDVYDIEFLEYVWFNTADGIFTSFVDHFYEMKKNATGKAERRMYKIILNALSGRMSLKTKRKNCVLGDWKSASYLSELGSDIIMGDNNRRVKIMVSDEIDIESRSDSHIQIGAAITSEAMCFIVRLAQKNYDNFRYTDTDSLHLGCTLDEVVGCEIGAELGQFKVEHEYTKAVYYAEKVYILENEEEGPIITWAGMPKECQRVIKAIIYDKSVNRQVQEEGGWAAIPYRECCRKQERIMSNYRKCKPECCTAEEWIETTERWRHSNFKNGNMWDLLNIKIPTSRTIVWSYKDYKFSQKKDTYTLYKSSKR